MANIRESCLLTQEQLDDLVENFSSLDQDGNGFIQFSELQQALKTAGYNLAGYEVRDLIKEFGIHDVNQDGKLDFEEFKYMCAKVEEMRNVGRKYKKVVKTKENLETQGGTTQASSEGTTHSIRKEEQGAFADWINKGLEADPDCKSYLPLNEEGLDLYSKCKDGILLCKMINLSVPETIDERTINKTNLNVYRRHENLILALNSSQAIGCNVVNMGPSELEKGIPHLILGLLWQIIRIGLLSDINIQHHPGLLLLLEEGEDINDLLKLSPESILIRWVNYHLRNSGCGRQIKNLTSDITDSVPYLYLLKQISPAEAGVNTMAEHEQNLEQRAEGMLQEADKIGCRSFVGPTDVVTGNYKLNLAFVANLFNMYPALEPPAEGEFEVIEETREERTYRNWMNSLGVSPFVNYLYNDLTNGLVLFQLYDIVRPGCVDWNKVHKKFSKLKANFERLENCNYAVLLGRESKFSLVGIDGSNILEGNQTLTLALVWQIMRAYTLAVLTQLAGTGHPIVEKEIIDWVNQKLKSAGKTSSLSSFQDHTISDARIVIDLIDALKPGAISYSTVRDAGSDEDKLANAKYAISMARKIGCRIYALPEDIVEVKPKMVMTVFACLMIKGYQPQQKSEI